MWFLPVSMTPLGEIEETKVCDNNFACLLPEDVFGLQIFMYNSPCM